MIESESCKYNQPTFSSSTDWGKGESQPILKLSLSKEYYATKNSKWYLWARWQNRRPLARLISALRNNILAAIHSQKCLVGALRPRWDIVKPQRSQRLRRAILRRQCHAQVADSLTMVLTTDSETTPTQLQIPVNSDIALLGLGSASSATCQADHFKLAS